MNHNRLAEKVTWISGGKCLKENSKQAWNGSDASQNGSC
jgi:hypothetical protein